MPEKRRTEMQAPSKRIIHREPDMVEPDQDADDKQPRKPRKSATPLAPAQAAQMAKMIRGGRRGP
jgi:hypothetical protein